MMRKSELLAVLAAMAAVSAFGQDQAPSQVQDDPPSRVARLNYMSGTVSFRPGSVDEWAAATLNYPLYNGDHLRADRAAHGLRNRPRHPQSRRPHGATLSHRRHAPCPPALSRRRREL